MQLEERHKQHEEFISMSFKKMENKLEDKVEIFRLKHENLSFSIRENESKTKDLEKSL